MKKALQVLILAGDGLNCERETAFAFSSLGGSTKIILLNELLQRPGLLKESHIFAIPGGFSFGDELGSGQVLALKMKEKLADSLLEFREQKKLMIGICNGFQVLVKLGLLPFGDFKTQIRLTHNQSGHFQNEWAQVEFPDSPCWWTKGLKAMQLPIRHAEGRLFAPDLEEQLKPLTAVRYQKDINGSFGQIAGLTDPTGQILGLMPHPEAYLSSYLGPSSTRFSQPESAGPGQFLFQNAFSYFNGELS